MTKNASSTTTYGTEEKQTADETNEAIDLDDLLPKIGEFGLYQKLLLWLVCLPACLPCGFCAFNQLFMTDVPDHWCKVSELEPLNLTREQRKILSIPRKDNVTFEKCSRYAVNWKEIIKMGGVVQVNESWPTENCVEGYEYDTSEVISSVVIDFDLVCEYDVYPTLGLVALNIGGPVGVYTFGLLNDRIGRKKSFFLCLSTLLLGSLMTAYAHEFWFWTLARVIVGLTIPAVYQIPFIISLELAGPNYRSFVTVMTCIFYTLGLILLSAVTYLLRDWRSLALATSVPFFFYYLYWFVLPESPRWLLMRERLEEANNVLKTIARVNGKELPEEYTNKLQKQVIEQKERGVTEAKSGSSNLVLPLVVMGAVSVVGGLSALRLPETLHTSLPQTAEEGEEFGKDWSYADCMNCGDPRKISDADSYENLDQLELTQAPLVEDEVPEIPDIRRSSMRKLVRQSSIVETQRDIDGNIKMTYWF
nr:carcinine transporter isoform X2 [Helicoverpa armigera]